MSSMIKAKVARAFYGAKTEASASLPIPAEELASRASQDYPITITGGILAQECLEQRVRLLG
jgi:hypothetical protein